MENQWAGHKKSPGWEQQGEHEKSSTIAVLFATMKIIVKIAIILPLV